MRPFAAAPRTIALGLAIVLTLLVALAPTALPADSKYQVTLSVGGSKLNDAFKDDASGMDLASAYYASLSYRVSVRPNVDVAFDSKLTYSRQDLGDLTLKSHSTFWGPGLRLHSRSTGLRPYVQGNLFLSSEVIEVPVGVTKDESTAHGAGFGISAGVELPLGDHLALPVEANYMHTSPADEITAIGVNVGLTLRLGESE